MATLVRPLSALSDGAADLLTRLFGGEHPETVPAGSEDELLIITRDDHDDGVIEPEERKMIDNVLRLEETTARDIMVPRVDIVAVDEDASSQEIVDAITEKGHSRLPVFRESIDEIVGILYAKDLFPFVIGSTRTLPIKQLLRPAYVVPESKRLDDLLAELRRNRVHIAVVADEYGGTAGLVTIEDILEEIVGEIHDEYDEETTLLEHVSDGEIIVDGRLPIEEVEEALGSDVHRRRRSLRHGRRIRSLAPRPAAPGGRPLRRAWDPSRGARHRRPSAAPAALDPTRRDDLPRSSGLGTPRMRLTPPRHVTDDPGWFIHRYDSVASTMDVAALARFGARERTAVVSAEQTAGRGRGGRTWRAAAGSAVFTTLILRPPVAAGRLSTLPLVVGVAVAEAIERISGSAVQLKWPNDVWLGEGRTRKVAGILVTSSLRGEGVDHVLVGIGINVLGGAPSCRLGRRPSRPPPGHVHAGRGPSRPAGPVRGRLCRFCRGGWPASLARWLARAALLGEQVTVEDAGRAITGTFLGVDDDGGLLR